MNTAINLLVPQNAWKLLSTQQLVVSHEGLGFTELVNSSYFCVPYVPLLLFCLLLFQPPCDARVASPSRQNRKDTACIITSGSTNRSARATSRCALIDFHKKDLLPSDGRAVQQCHLLDIRHDVDGRATGGELLNLLDGCARRVYCLPSIHYSERTRFSHNKTC